MNLRSIQILEQSQLCLQVQARVSVLKVAFLPTFIFFDPDVLFLFKAKGQFFLCANSQIIFFRI
jgi:hypothetical protein